jgi:FixJ family two-component response regulator
MLTQLSKPEKVTALKVMKPLVRVNRTGGEQFIVFLVDDERAVLENLTGLLRTTGYRIKAYSSSETFLAEHDASVPGCVVLDMAMPVLNGLDVQRALKRQDFDRPVIFLTRYASVHSTVLAMRAGAVDVLVKPVKASHLLQAIKLAEEQDKVGRCAERERRATLSLLEKLSPREKEVLSHVILGRQNKQIAGMLGISLKTAKVHRGHMMAKMGVASVAELVRMTSSMQLDRATNELTGRDANFCFLRKVASA